MLLSTAICGPYFVQKARNVTICESGVLLSFPRLTVYVSFASGTAFLTRITEPPHCTSGTSPDSECQIAYSEILSVKVSQDLRQADEKGEAPRLTTSAANTESKGAGGCRVSPFPNFLCDRIIGAVSWIAMDKQLHKYEYAPSQAGKE